MNVPFLDLSRQYQRIRAEVGAAVEGVLERGHYILGDEVATFEREFAAYCEARHAVGVGSGTDAVHLALRACGVRPGDHVRLAARYDALLVDAPIARPTEMESVRHAYPLYVVRSPRRNALRRHLDQQGIGSAVHYPTPVHRQPAYRHLEYVEGEFPCAESACRQVLSLPFYPELTEDELSDVVANISSFSS